MIYSAPLTAAQQRKSQHNYNLFSAINGLSYMCLGETVLILLAVQLETPDYFVSTLGAMLYFGFLLLPLGKVFTARVGAAQTQTVCWVLRNIAALLVGLCPLLYVAGLRHLSWGVLLFGAFMFYGFRAAGVVMSQPLIGDFTDDKSRAKVLAVSVGLFYASCFIALISISILLKMTSSIWMLSAIIVLGALLGFTASNFIRKIDETENIRLSARKPLGNALISALHDSVLKRQIAAGFSINLAVIMLIPISMLALKRGFQVSDNDALIYALVQCAACALMSVITGKISEKIGPRKVMLYSYILMLSLGPLWLLAPTGLSFLYMMLPFLIAGGTLVSANNATAHYFLQTVETEKRVAASIFISVVTGAGAGVFGMLIAGLLLRFLTDGVPAEQLLPRYRWYFLLATLFLLPGVKLITRLSPLPMEKRKIKKTWDQVN